MLPRRFVTEFPARCLALLDAVEPAAQEMEMMGSFALLAAASMFVIPFERLDRRHFIDHERESDLAMALRRIQRQKWQQAEFWNGECPPEWRFSRIMGDPNHVSNWRNEAGNFSMSADANTVATRKAGEVLRVLRNALAHGNIIYLNKHGHETPETRLHWLAFLSRYEESEERKAAARTYRMVAVTEEDFLAFIRRWARWLAQFPEDELLQEVA